MHRTPEEIAAESFKLRPRTPQVFVWLDDSGSLHAVAPDHANGGLRKIELTRTIHPEALASLLTGDSTLLAEKLLDQVTFLSEQTIASPNSTRLAEEEKQRERAVRSFDCPLTESRCTEAGKAGCSRTRCVRQEREDNAFRRHEEEKARAARGGSQQSRHMRVRGSKSAAAALARAIASIKL
jgi:hypothetical protein